MANKDLNSLQKKDTAILLLLSIVVLVVVSVLLQLPANCVQEWYYYPDSRSYREAAVSLYLQGGHANSIRPFGYPVLIGIPYLFGAISDKTIVIFAVLLNVLAWLATVQLVFRLALSFAGRRWAWIASVSFLLCISHVVSAYQSLSETIFLCTILAGLLAFVRYLEQGRALWLIAALAALCYSVTVRPVTYYFAILATIVVVALLLKKGNLRLAAVAVCVFAGTLGVQMANMYRCYGKFTVSFIQNYTLHMYVMAVAESKQTGTDLVAIQLGKVRHADSILHGLQPDTRQYVRMADDYYANTVQHNLKNNMANVLKAMWSDMVMNSSDGNQGISTLHNLAERTVFTSAQAFFTKITRWQNKLFTMLCVVGMLGIGCVWVWKRKIDSRMAMLLIMNAVAGYLLLTAGISFWQGDRFNAVLYPFTFINICFLGHILLSGKRASTNGW